MSYHYIQTIIGLYPVQRRNVKWIHVKTLSRELKREKNHSIALRQSSWTCWITHLFSGQPNYPIITTFKDEPDISPHTRNLTQSLQTVRVNFNWWHDSEMNASVGHILVHLRPSCMSLFYCRKWGPFIMKKVSFYFCYLNPPNWDALSVCVRV